MTGRNRGPWLRRKGLTLMQWVGIVLLVILGALLFGYFWERDKRIYEYVDKIQEINMAPN
jgi:hypothetical protein